MTAAPPEDVKQKIIQHIQRVQRAVSRDIARATKIDKHTVDKTIIDLINDGTLVYDNYGGVTYIALAGQTGKREPPATD
jgi:Mn-dependent DtxR family transcriptional regulator